MRPEAYGCGFFKESELFFSKAPLGSDEKTQLVRRGCDRASTFCKGAVVDRLLRQLELFSDIELREEKPARLLESRYQNSLEPLAGGGTPLGALSSEKKKAVDTELCSLFQSELDLLGADPSEG